MKYGMNLLLWTGDVTDAHLPILEALKAQGYDGVEIPMFSYDLAKFARLGKQLDSLGLERTVVTIRTLEDNPASENAAIRAKGLDLNKQAIDCCHALGSPLLCGPFHSALGHFSGSGPSVGELGWAADGLRAAAEHAATAGVTFGVEYLNRFECYLLNSAASAVELMKKVDHPNCRTMYDTFHANIEEKCLKEAIRTISPYMAHFHVSENDRSTPGTGHVDWHTTFDVLKEVGYDGWLMVEAFGLALPELAAATKIWRKMFSNELTLAADSLRFMKHEWAKRTA